MTFPFPENHDKACCKFIGKARYLEHVHGVFKCTHNPGGIFYDNETRGYYWVTLDEAFKDLVYDGSLYPEDFRLFVTIIELYERVIPGK